MTKIHLSFLFAFLASGLLAAEEPSIKIEQAWVRAVPGSSTDTAAYMTLINSSDQPLRLTGGSTAIAEMVMPMATTKKKSGGQEMMGMESVNDLTIPAHGKLTLSPDGDHLMLMTLKEHPKAGEKVKLTLQFDPGAKEVTVETLVAREKP